MATGYTDKITDTTTLPEFIMRCARAFGALIEMRDDPLDATIPNEFKVSSHHSDRAKESRDRLNELTSMTSGQVAAACNKDNDKQLEYWQKRKEERAQLKSRYTRLLKMVRTWKPPTPDHVEMKNFMVSQITDSIKFDCYTVKKPKKATPKKWLEDQIKNENWSLNYHNEHYAKEEAQVKERSEWVKALRESLKGL